MSILEGRGAIARVREVRVTTTDSKDATVRVEYEDGVTHVILPHKLISPLEPAAAKLQVVDQLKGLGADLPNIEPDQVIVEWRNLTPAERKGMTGPFR